MLKYSLLVFVFLFVSSCYTPKYTLHDNLKYSEKNHINKNSTFVLTKNNFPFYADKFNTKVDTDYKSILGDKLILKQNYLNLDTTILIDKFLDDKELKLIKEESKSDYLIVLKTILKPSFTESSSNNMPNVKREYHIILELYDLTNYKRIYTKESISVLDFTHEGISVSKTKESQLNKTFELLINDFKKYVNNKG